MPFKAFPDKQEESTTTTTTSSMDIIEDELTMLTDDPKSWHGSSLLDAKQITGPGLRLLFKVASSMRGLVRDDGGDDRLRNHVINTIFYEASTRTSCSFQAAIKRLGGSNLHVDGKGNSAAGKKGESLEDTVRCLECYSDVTILRHPQQGSVGKVVGMARKPVINAGDGVGEHPTQALLDVFTIHDELKLYQYKVKPHLTVTILGDNKNGRTVHSLAKTLCACRKVLWTNTLTIRYCTPAGLEMPEYVLKYVDKFADEGVTQETVYTIDEAIENANVLYVTRIQKERFATEEEYHAVKGSYVVDEEVMARAPENMIVCHPLPRVDEIKPEVDKDRRAAYFRQMENGMFVRMALLVLVLGKSRVMYEKY